MKSAVQQDWESSESSIAASRAVFRDGPFKSLAHTCLPVKVCDKGSWLVTQGDRMDCLYIVQEGRMMLTRMSSSGKETILDLVGPGHFFGDVPLLNDGEAPFNALALQRTVLLVVRRNTFSMVLEDPEAAQDFLRIVANRCSRAWEQVEILGCSSLSERVETAILRLCQQHGVRTSEGIEIPVNQSQLAAMVGVTRESLNRQIRDLRERSILKVRKASDRTSVVVLAPEELFHPGWL